MPNVVGCCLLAMKVLCIVVRLSWRLMWPQHKDCCLPPQKWVCLNIYVTNLGTRHQGRWRSYATTSWKNTCLVPIKLIVCWARKEGCIGWWIWKSNCLFAFLGCCCIERSCDVINVHLGCHIELKDVTLLITWLQRLGLIMKDRPLSPQLSWDTKEVLQICASSNGMTGDTTVSMGDNDPDNAMLMWILKSNEALYCVQHRVWNWEC